MRSTAASETVILFSFCRFAVLSRRALTYELTLTTSRGRTLPRADNPERVRAPTLLTLNKMWVPGLCRLSRGAALTGKTRQTVEYLANEAVSTVLTRSTPDVVLGDGIVASAAFSIVALAFEGAQAASVRRLAASWAEVLISSVGGLNGRWHFTSVCPYLTGIYRAGTLSHAVFVSLPQRLVVVV